MGENVEIFSKKPDHLTAKEKLEISPCNTVMHHQESFANIFWIARKTNKLILFQNKLELSLEAKMWKPRLSCFGHIMKRQDSLEKTIMLGNVDDRRKRGRLNVR